MDRVTKTMSDTSDPPRHVHRFPVPPARLRASERSGRVGPGLAIALAIAYLTAACTGGDGTAEGAVPNSGSAPPVTIGLQSQAQAWPHPDPDGFVEAWEQALTVDHATTGRVTVSQNQVTGEVGRTYAVRRARRDGRELEQIATTAVITVSGTDGAMNSACEESSDGRFLCSKAEWGLSVDERLQRIADAVGADQRSAGTQASYLVRPFDAARPDSGQESKAVGRDPGTERCWVATALPDQSPNGWGERTTFCFDISIGALSFQETVDGDGTETFVAHSMLSSATGSDLDPVAGLHSDSVAPSANGRD